jgi:SPP1 family phage portal protein
MKPIEEIMQNADLNSVYALLTRTKPPFTESVAEIEQQWHPQGHKVMNPIYRRRKTIKVLTGKDKKTGQPIYKEKKVERCRIAIPMQKVLVNRAVGFLFSNAVRYAMVEGTSEQATALFNEVMKCFKSNKLKYKDKQLARTVMHERECAELWYFETDANGQPQRLRMKLLKPSEGNKLFPHFDDWGNMDGFAREYFILDESGKQTQHFDVYTSRYVYRYTYDGGSLMPIGARKQHGFKKVPVIYYRQEHAEWFDVQIPIERVEDLLSNWADTNDYFGKPAYVATGEVQGFAEKGETGSVYQLKEGADLKVLSWDNSPTSIGNELSTLFNIIFSYSQIPDISFETMKQLGNNTSGVAIQLMFTDPHMKAEDKIELYGEMFQRRYNLVQNGIATSLLDVPDNVLDEIEVEPKFEPYMPKNLTETLQLLNMSTGNRPTMSQKEAVRQNPLVDNPTQVIEQLNEEAQQEAQLSMVTNMFGTATGEE